jgi:aconitate hydratase
VKIVKGPNIASLPDLTPPPDALELPILLKLGDNISTDTISPAGARALPFRSNIAQIAKFSYDIVDGTYHDRAMAVRAQGGHAIVGGRNYGQGSSREHAALAPRSLGLHLVIAKGVARIHWQNLVNFGVLPLIFMDAADYDRLWQGDVIRVEGIHAAIKSGPTIPVKNLTRKLTFVARHGLSDRQVDVYMAGGLINWKKARL